MSAMIITYRRTCDYCGDTMTPKQAGSVLDGVTNADIAALQAGYVRHNFYWACPHCYDQLIAGNLIRPLEEMIQQSHYQTLQYR